MAESGELPAQTLREKAIFPSNGEAELKRLREIIRGKDADIISIGNLGYLVQNRRTPYVAEAPLVLLDWDDTGAQTTVDKAKCWAELETMGVSREVIKFCDKVSRIDIGQVEPAYEPELEMRLLTHALSSRKDGQPVEFTNELKAELEKMREDIVTKGNIEELPVSSTVQELYKRTRYTSTLYPDTLDSMRALRGDRQWPNSNVALLTYGDPEFQLTKTARLLDENIITQIFITKALKGKFFQEVLRQNPYKNLPLQYRYSETPRNVGVDFKSWQVMVVLFDDDPKQVDSFNNIAKKEGIEGLAVVRVRRAGTKSEGTDTEVGRLVAEMHPSNTYLDTDIFRDVMGELRVRELENYLAFAVKEDGADILNHPEVARIVASVAVDRSTDLSTIREKALQAAGFQKVGTFQTGDTDEDVTILRQ